MRSTKLSALLAFTALSLLQACGYGALPQAAIEHDVRGVTLLGENLLDDAEASFRLALEYHPEFVEAHSHLGLVALEREHYTNALAHFTDAVRLNDQFASAHVGRGVALEALDRDEDAERAYRFALSVDPGLVSARKDLVRMLMGQRRFEEARPQLLRLVQLESNTEHQASLAYVDLQLGNVRSAKRRVEEVLREDAECALALLVRGSITARSGDLANAERDYRAAARDQGVKDDAELRLAALLIEDGRAAEAAGICERLLEDRGDEAGVKLLLAHYALSTGDRETAQQRAREVYQATQSEAALAVLRAAGGEVGG